MDRRRRRARALGLFLALAGAAALAADARPPLQAVSWIPRDADPVRVFATQPTECLARPADPALARSIEVGRAAFRTPLLLGGQAARAGLSCESCHRNGRGNPDFHFPGASGAPGTADVTLSLFSSRRGNGTHDPKAIPDLSGPRSSLKVAQSDLPAFIRGLVVEEFDGREPPPAVLAGLADYVGALAPTHCPAPTREVTSPVPLLDDARRAVSAAESALAAGDRPTALLMIAAARARLFLIDERYADLPAEVARLRAADARLAALQAAAREGRLDTAFRLVEWRGDTHELERRLLRRQRASLFNPARLHAATNRRLPPKTS